jgi:sialate O-acetylesterase
MTSGRITLALLWGLVWALLGPGRGEADVRLPGLFSDHMVLQQGRPIPVWGWADPGEKVVVSLGDREVSTTASGGTWRVDLPAHKAGGPFALVVQGKNRIERSDVLVGEVWIASGQSNMGWPLSRSHDPEADIRAATHPQLRLFTVPQAKADAPADDVAASWQVCTPETVRDFSAVAYYFGRDLAAARRVPVGLIHTAWGGSPAEVWIRHEVLAGHPRFQREILDAYPEAARKFQAELAAWDREAAFLRAEGKQPTKPRPWWDWKPSTLYNGMIAPLIPYGIAGAIWYQGESNASRADQYRSLFPNLIQNWRDDWRLGDFPFLAVQLAPFDPSGRSLDEIRALPGDSTWAELREAQLMAAQTLKNVGLAVITDHGDKDDIHPPKKEPVGARLALLARAIAYGERVAARGPIYRKMKVKKDRIIIDFDYTEGGLEARGGKLRGFAIAGEDGRFLWAEATIEGERVVVSHPLLSEPKAVRYGWADYPIVNLFNRAGLPASPFRTDDLPMLTAPRE